MPPAIQFDSRPAPSESWKEHMLLGLKSQTSSTLRSVIGCAMKATPNTEEEVRFVHDIIHSLHARLVGHGQDGEPSRLEEVEAGWAIQHFTSCQGSGSSDKLLLEPSINGSSESCLQSCQLNNQINSRKCRGFTLDKDGRCTYWAKVFFSFDPDSQCVFQFSQNEEEELSFFHYDLVSTSGACSLCFWPGTLCQDTSSNLCLRGGGTTDCSQVSDRAECASLCQEVTACKSFSWEPVNSLCGISDSCDQSTISSANDNDVTQLYVKRPYRDLPNIRRVVDTVQHFLQGYWLQPVSDMTVPMFTANFFKNTLVQRIQSLSILKDSLDAAESSAQSTAQYQSLVDAERSNMVVRASDLDDELQNLDELLFENDRVAEKDRAKFEQKSSEIRLSISQLQKAVKKASIGQLVKGIFSCLGKIVKAIATGDVEDLFELGECFSDFAIGVAEMAATILEILSKISKLVEETQKKLPGALI